MTRSNMNTQRTATGRNSQAEMVANFIFNEFAKRLVLAKVIENDFVLHQQHLFESEFTRDRWDHALNLVTIKGEEIIVWGQTTCYKGHAGGETEANKTYEVRETLTEALSLKAANFDLNEIRTIHITFGDPDYVYPWFRPMKTLCFDLSLYMQTTDDDIFTLIDACIGGLASERQVEEALTKELHSANSLGRVIETNICSLYEWWMDRDHLESEMANMQAMLMVKHKPTDIELDVILASATGSNIKASAVELILSNQSETEDKVVASIVADLFEKKPFLRTAQDQIQNWNDFQIEIQDFLVDQASVEECLFALWSSGNQGLRESARRILLRLHSSESVDYIQDTGISGVTEHNLYGGRHTVQQTQELVSILRGQLHTLIKDKQQLLTLMRSEGKAILRDQVYFEAKNGTSSTASFEYVIRSLEAVGFNVTNAPKIGLRLIGYHAELTDAGVRPYTNFKIVLGKDQKPLCILKSKFFSVREFDRRCKEEGCVGLSLKYKWDGTMFVERFEVPIIMCIDMESDFTPPEFSIRKLNAMGWDIAFGPKNLIEILQRLDESDL